MRSIYNKSIFAIAFFLIFATSIVAQEIQNNGAFNALKFQTFTWPYYTVRQITSPDGSPIVFQLPNGPNVGIKTGSEAVDNSLQIGEGPINYSNMKICLKSSFGSMGFSTKNGSSIIRTSQNLIVETDGKNVGIGVPSPISALDLNGSFRLSGFIKNTVWAGSNNRIAFFNHSGDLWASSVPMLDGPICKQNLDGSYNHKRYEFGVLIWDSTNNTPPTYIELANTEYFKKAFSALDDSEMEKRVLERLKNSMPTSQYEKMVSENADVKIFPNPANDKVTAKSSFGEVVDMSIYDMSGNKLKHQDGNTIDVSKLEPDRYVTISKILIKK